MMCADFFACLWKYLCCKSCGNGTDDISYHPIDNDILIKNIQQFGIIPWVCGLFVWIDVWVI